MITSKSALAIGIICSLFLHAGIVVWSLLDVSVQRAEFDGIEIAVLSTASNAAGQSSSEVSSEHERDPVKVFERGRRAEAPKAASSSSKRASPSAAPQAGVSGGPGERPAYGRSNGALHIEAAPLPPYPIAARSVGFEGRVLLSLVIAPDGNILRADIEKSSGRDDCDAAARETILQKWRFAPFASDVPIRQEIALRFQLQ